MIICWRRVPGGPIGSIRTRLVIRYVRSTCLELNCQEWVVNWSDDGINSNRAGSSVVDTNSAKIKTLRHGTLAS